jgi:hypothetical protein
MSEAVKVDEPVVAAVAAPVLVAEPTVEAPATVETTPEAATEAPAAAEEATEPAAAAVEDVKPVEEGVLGYKGPGLLKYVLPPFPTASFPVLDKASRVQAGMLAIIITNIVLPGASSSKRSSSSSEPSPLT